jgi:hypothetical protein
MKGENVVFVEGQMHGENVVFVEAVLLQFGEDLPAHVNNSG